MALQPFAASSVKRRGGRGGRARSGPNRSTPGLATPCIGGTSVGLASIIAADPIACQLAQNARARVHWVLFMGQEYAPSLAKLMRLPPLWMRLPVRQP